ncbi:uncharacterized protein LOC131032203 isoform X3 [Cryptomeria japonica]|uniref:uncharacterized protein LOC131032203 isoform X3 n=1 Tax=Cryptomeria japonica TaxID=3369 RepID=UPI0027DA3163|nr:uncharacterized protein LOC131032203 isoform X3 [Cryptomeria japonica]
MQLPFRIRTSFLRSSSPHVPCRRFSFILDSARCFSSAMGSTAIGDVAATHPGLAKVVLKKGKAKVFQDGSPMVYSGAVDRIVGRPSPRTGDIVLVTNESEKPFAWGIYNSVSMFCVRLMQMEEDSSRDPSSILDMEKLLQLRMNNALDMRRRLGLPRSDTNAYRLVNSEGDRLSGLIVDVFSNHAVIASSAAWVEKYRSMIELLVRELLEIDDIKWRPSIEILKEEGLNINLEYQKPISAENRVKVTVFQVMENGIHYIVSMEGQKTGFYADQRDNRLLVGSLSKDRTVLDLFCYSGGFALNAAFGGAVHVTGIDSSSPALKLAEENYKLNNFDSSRISFLKEDATDFMKVALSDGKSWDLIILDPPKLAPSRKVLQRAANKYHNLNGLAMRLTKKGGLLMTCSCSAAMTQSGSFLSILQIDGGKCLGLQPQTFKKLPSAY